MLEKLRRPGQLLWQPPTSEAKYIFQKGGLMSFPAKLLIYNFDIRNCDALNIMKNILEAKVQKESPRPWVSEYLQLTVPVILNRKNYT